jgi:hypothetical protein
VQALLGGTVKNHIQKVTKIIASMLVCYLLLYGPALWLFWHSRLPRFVAGALIRSYDPVHSMAACSTSASRLEDWYLSLWVDRTKWPASLEPDQDPPPMPRGVKRAG